MALKPFIKICCIASREEARLAISAGASAIGLVSAMPSGPGPIAESLIADIAATVPPPVATFMLTCRQDAESIIEQHNAVSHFDIAARGFCRARGAAQTARQISAWSR